MLPKVVDKNSIIRKATLTIFAFSFLQLPVWAQLRAESDVTLVDGQTGLVGLARGDMLRYTAFNPPTSESGQTNLPISLRLRIFDEHGDVVAVSPEVVIPPNQFRWVDFSYDDLPITADSTGRKQIRTMPLWGLRARPRILVSTSLEISNSTTGAGTFRFFFNLEALP